MKPTLEPAISLSRSQSERHSTKQANETAKVCDVNGLSLASVSYSLSFKEWLVQHNTSIVLSSYMTGYLVFVGIGQDKKLTVTLSHYGYTSGIWVNGDDLYVGGLNTIWRLAAIEKKAPFSHAAIDRLYTPRTAHIIGDLDVHELSVDRDNNVIFINTAYSCLSRVDYRAAFVPLWTPPFISALKPEHRCHLNGLYTEKGEPMLATAISSADEFDGWRGRRQNTGVLIDIIYNKVLLSNLSMPHSPRRYDGSIWFLESGRGYIMRLNPDSHCLDKMLFCPGFLRGFDIYGSHAVVGLSKPRGEHGFEGLAIAKELEDRDLEAYCGLNIVDLNTADLIGSLKFTAGIDELFEVRFIPGVRNPMSHGLMEKNWPQHQ